MRHVAVLLVPVLLVLWAGCGLREDTLLVDLDEQEIAQLCEEVGGSETYLCEKNGVSIKFTVSAECEAAYSGLSAGCPVTVGQAKLCEEERRAAYEANPCRADSPESCQPVDDCFLDVVLD